MILVECLAVSEISFWGLKFYGAVLDLTGETPFEQFFDQLGKLGEGRQIAVKLERNFWEGGGSFDGTEELFGELGEIFFQLGLITPEFREDPCSECRSGRVTAAEAAKVEELLGPERVQQLVFRTTPFVLAQPGSGIC